MTWTETDDDDLQDIFHALAHPVRRYLLGLIRVGGASAGDLAMSAAARFDISRPRVSQHLRVLADADLVYVSADAQHRYYVLREGAAEVVCDWARSLRTSG